MPVSPLNRRAFMAGTGGLTLTASGILRNSAKAAVEEQGIEPFSKAMQPLARPLPVPTTTFQDVQGEDVSLSHWKGQAFLLHLWATWCPPCIRELPDVDSAIHALGRNGPPIVAINTLGGDVAMTQAFYAAHHIGALPIYIDLHGELLKALGPLPGMEPGQKGIPRSYVVDAKGEMRAASLGLTAWDPRDVQQHFETLTKS
ncbi:thiol:disulfide interchange protein II [Neoasaia chiangmaiensis NBRC 101099]|uniref:Uncharacterized protein n=2 Tax=Neoasaia chiangmaiensis TaxID=320497 RepID=A0A1U9KMI1_9PROT|nr:TlpA disulfide reductase family protein [Neoasaia chiangmaiensis]AQS86996.1 hypothetical protein A0U93_02505 [Neoasaia chiangmaiensis]GBR37795.1 thiol:disulfide interchange protein II [Neoasaia chiangmaiensis NBRC 101099]GEN15124.1 hypothetical protein NCH01_15550 [Neoasaia chiangmaiensis]